MTRSVTILGSTGTIGCNALKIIASQPEQFSVVALTAGDNVDTLIEQARMFAPRVVAIANKAHYEILKTALADLPIEVTAGEDAVTHAAQMQSDVVLSAIVGAAALAPTLAAIRQGKIIALANKECLVCAGELVMDEVKKHGATLIPVDSEHNAIFQLAPHWEYVERLTITASGGPFRTWSREQMATATPAQAVKHPNWTMGAKISVDSATLMNKALELIEAYRLFPIDHSKLGVLIHPQSMVHCLVEMRDGSVLSQMSEPDMCTPIAHALAYPKRIHAPVKKLNLAEIGALEFSAPDETRFPALRLAREVMAAGGNAATIFNAANEIAVARFLQGDIGFLEIVSLVEKTLNATPNGTPRDMEEILECDQKTRLLCETL